MARDWGPWTVIKLEALERYLGAFTTASQRAKATLYLDLFGGRPDNRSRGRAGQDDESEIFAGSALRAANVVPRFSRLIISELNASAAAEQRARLAEVAGDRARVVQGDCNLVMPAELDDLAAEDDGWRWAPTFALVDQYSAEVKWSTLEALAGFKHPSRTKVELCIYVGPSFMIRGLHGSDGAVNAGYAARLDEMFGSPLWRDIMAAREDHKITGAQAAAEFVNLMRWLLERKLGYRTTLPLQLKNTRGHNIFSMIFATDHDVGERIMLSLFEGAEEAVAEMVALSKLHRKQAEHAAIGDDWLFEAVDLAATSKGNRERSTLAKPREPFRYVRSWDRDKRP